MSEITGIRWLPLPEHRGSVPRKPNYDFEKRRKEMDRKAKKDARREEKRLRREQQEGGGGPEPGFQLRR